MQALKNFHFWISCDIVSHVCVHFPRNIDVSPLGCFSWDATINKHLPLWKTGSMKETLDAKDEQERKDESSMCASLNFHISPANPIWPGSTCA